MTEEERSRGVLQKGLTILRCLAEGSTSVTLADVSRCAGLDRSTTHRLLQVLVKDGMVHQDAETRSYRLHVGVLQLASTVIQNLNGSPNVSTYLEHLRNVTGESAGYHVRIDVHRVCLEEAESHQALRMTSRVGRLYPLCAGASGKAIVAFLPDQELQTVLATVPALGSWRGRVRELRDSLATTRRLGYAVSHEETTEGARAIAAPIWDFRGRVTGSINLTGPASRFLPPGDEPDISRLLLEAAEKISQEGGYAVPGKGQR